MPVPAQLLSLLPPPPRAGWPAEFALRHEVVGLRERAAAQRAMDMFNPLDDPEPYVPWSELWPARRRAQRLSFAIWLAIREQNRDLQLVLETASTADRLRLALCRLRELREQVKGMGR